jgi:hypothetical protein
VQAARNVTRSVLSAKRDLEGETEHAEEALPVTSVDGTLKDVRWTYRNKKIEYNGVDHPDDHKPLECKTVFEMCTVDTCSVVYVGQNELYALSEFTRLRRQLERSAQQG